MSRFLRGRLRAAEQMRDAASRAFPDRFHVDQPVFDLHTAPMTLAMVVLQAICDASPADTQARLEAFESSAARRQLFLG